MPNTLGSIRIEPALPPEKWVDHATIKDPRRGWHEFKVRNHVSETVGLSAAGTVEIIGESLTQITPNPDSDGDLRLNGMGLLEKLVHSLATELVDDGIGHTIKAYVLYQDECEGVFRLRLAKSDLAEVLALWKRSSTQERQVWLNEHWDEALMLWPDGTVTNHDGVVVAEDTS